MRPGGGTMVHRKATAPNSSIRLFSPPNGQGVCVAIHKI